MDIPTRHEKILGILRADGQVDVEDLAARFALTTQTIRNDLRDLAARGLAQRTHGGARRVESVTNREYADRRQQNAAAKVAMGQLAATLIPNDCSLSLNIGTSTEQVARALSGHSGLMVVSNNINIINLLMGSRCRELVLVGGSVRAGDGAIVGEDAVDFINRYKVDFAVIGASALDADGAVLDFDAREVSVARAILKNARTRILVADGSKFDRSAPVRICTVADLDHIITDRAPPAEFMAAARAGETEIIIADQTDV